MPDVIRPCVLSKGDNGMPHPTPSDRLFCPRAKMACHARHPLTVCAVQGILWLSTPDIVQTYVQYKGDGMPHPMSSDRVCFPKGIIECQAQHHPCVCAVQGQ